MSEGESAETLMPPDEPSFRTVLGHFATGVTIITAMDGNEPIGVSANSFTSVSLDPPLVLFCASKVSTTWPRIEAAGKFTVNILNEHQEDVCRAVDASTYLSGSCGGREYTDEAVLRDHGIALRFDEFEYPRYEQLWGDFEPDLSVLDVLFNCGPASRELITR